MQDKIDISDFRFASSKTNGRFTIENRDDNEIFIDSAPYASAINNSKNHLSQLRVDLRITPFVLKFDQWGKFGELSYQESKEKITKQTAWIIGNGMPGGAAPLKTNDES